jgi:hypothetical protein
MGSIRNGYKAIRLPQLPNHAAVINVHVTSGFLLKLLMNWRSKLQSCALA